MTREEEIKLALSKYIEERGNCGDYIAEAERDAAFIAGAKWVDEHPKNVWHSIDVEPKKGSWFLGQIGDNAYDTFIAEIEGKSMKDWLIGCNIKQWVYISDLLHKIIMIPKRIYLTEQELLDTITGEKMVSCNEPYEDMTEEYINLKQIWHDASEEPKKNKYILIEVVNTLNPGDIEYYVEYSDNWMITAMKTGFKYRWLYTFDLSPKGGGE